MNIFPELDSIRDSLHNIFSNLRKTARENLSLVIVCLTQSESCQTPQIITKMVKYLGTNYKANEMKLQRFLSSKEFNVDNKLWRCHVKMVLQLLTERKYIKKGSQIAINVDFTTKKDKFLILSASIPFFGRGIPICFSLRKYPQKKDEIDQVMMERAFLRELQRLLPHEDYKYTIVADRGFGNVRFMKDCLEFGFDYIVRTTENKYFQMNDLKEKKKIKEIEEGSLDFPSIKLQTDKFETRLVLSTEEGAKERWSIFTNLTRMTYNEIVKQYGDRFKIEKMFQDQKSSGFNIESLKIESYSRFKRLLFCIFVAQTIMMFVGDWVKKEAVEIRKKYVLHIEMISALSKLVKD